MTELSAVSLPSEIFNNIAQSLEQRDLYSCVLVCKKWQRGFEHLPYMYPSLSSESGIKGFISTIQQRASISTTRYASDFDVRRVKFIQYTADMPAIVSFSLMLKQLPIKSLTLANINDPQCVTAILM